METGASTNPKPAPRTKHLKKKLTSVKRPDKPPPLPRKKSIVVDSTDENEYSIPDDFIEQAVEARPARNQDPPPPFPLRSPSNRISNHTDTSATYNVPVSISREDGSVNARSAPCLPLRPPPFRTLTPSRTAPKPSKTTWYIELDLLTNEYITKELPAKLLFTETAKPMVKYDSVYSKPVDSKNTDVSITKPHIAIKPQVGFKPHTVVKPPVAVKRKNLKTKKSKSIFYDVNDDTTLLEKQVNLLNTETKQELPPQVNNNYIGSSIEDKPSAQPLHNYFIETETGPRCRVKVQHSRSNYEELELYVDDVIEMHYYDWDDKVIGRLRGVVGTFSLEYVDIIEQLPKDNDKVTSIEDTSPHISTDSQTSNVIKADIHSPIHKHLPSPQSLIDFNTTIDTSIQERVIPFHLLDNTITDITPPISEIDMFIQEITPPISYIETPIHDILPPTSNIDTIIQDIVPTTSDIDTLVQDIVPPTSYNHDTYTSKRFSELIGKLNINHIHSFTDHTRKSTSLKHTDNKGDSYLEPIDNTRILTSIITADNIGIPSSIESADNIIPTSDTNTEISEDNHITANVIYEFIPENESELHLTIGDTIVDLYIVDSDWMKGTQQSDVTKSGIFPTSFVHVNGKVNMIKTLIMKARVLFNFVAENEGEMTIETGDFIEDITEVSSDWLVGQCNGKRGMFPLSFVSIKK